MVWGGERVRARLRLGLPVEAEQAVWKREGRAKDGGIVEAVEALDGAPCARGLRW